MLHKTLTQTSSIWLKLIHSHSTWWWQSSWTLPSWIQPFCTKRTSLIHSDSTWWWQPSWNLPCWIQTLPSYFQTPCYLLSDSLKNTLPPLRLCLKLIHLIKLNDGYHLEFFHIEFCHFAQKVWLNLIQSDSKSFILTQLIDGSHLEFCHLVFSHFAQKNFTCSFWLNLMMAAILNSAMLDSDTAILDSNTFLFPIRFTQKHSSSTLSVTQSNSIWLT